MQESLQPLSEPLVALISTGFAGLCGALSYGLKVVEGKPFNFVEFVILTLISAFCGYGTFELLLWQGVPPQVSGSLAGVSGYMGTRLIRILTVAFQKKLGVTKEDINEQ